MSRLVRGTLFGTAALGAWAVAERKRLQAVTRLPSVAEGLDAIVQPPGQMREDRPLLVVALGDSVMSGVGAGTVTAAVPYVLATRVAAALEVPVRIRSLGRSGAKVADVVTEQVPRLTEDGPPAIVVVSVGANDTTHLTPPARFASDLRAVIAEGRTAGAPVVVSGIPDFRSLAALSAPLRYAAFTYGERIHRIQQEVADAEPGAVFVDVKAQSSEAFRESRHLLAEDGFHPSAAGCTCIADALAPAVVEALRSPLVRDGPPRLMAG